MQSTAEAEYIAISEVMKQALWTRRLVAAIKGREATEASTVLMLFRDNKGAIQLTYRVSNTLKIKYINTAFYYILNEVNQGSIRIF